MISSVMLSGLLMISGQSVDFPEVWKKIEGKWSYVGEVKEKPQILFWIEKKTKTNSKNIVTKEIKKMPFIVLTPKGEVLDLEPAAEQRSSLRSAKTSSRATRHCFT